MNELMLEATEAAVWREHKLSSWKYSEYKSIEEYAIAYCKECPAWVVVETNPAPNSIDIGGPAVAVNCPMGKDS